MAIGESFTVSRRLQPSMSGYAKRLQIKIKTRKENKDRIRVWRMA
jgi:hypothetical protein